MYKQINFAWSEACIMSYRKKKLRCMNSASKKCNIRHSSSGQELLHCFRFRWYKNVSIFCILSSAKELIFFHAAHLVHLAKKHPRSVQSKWGEQNAVWAQPSSINCSSWPHSTFFLSSFYAKFDLFSGKLSLLHSRGVFLVSFFVLGRLCCIATI